MINEHIRAYGLDTSHFLGQAHARGKPSPRANSASGAVFTANSLRSNALRKLVIRNELLDYCCAECGITEWRDRPLRLHLDHINGVSNDNRLENLRFLCPNCHDQTETWGAPNAQDRVAVEPPKCLLCGAPVSRKEVRCRTCAARATSRTKIEWPPTADLVRMVQATSYLAVARQLGVSDNAIRRRIVDHPV